MGFCIDCKWWRNNDEDVSAQFQGGCHRYPPKYEHQGMCDKYPITDNDDWCGEFKPKVAMNKEMVDYKSQLSKPLPTDSKAADLEIDAIFADPKNPFHAKSYHPLRKLAVMRVTELFEIKAKRPKQ